MIKRKSDSNKGITLIALIITIIVLLILAGISISALIGDNGVLKQAQGASKKTDVARFEEDAGLVYSDIYATEIQKKEFNRVKKEEVLEKLKNEYDYEIKTVSVGAITEITPSLQSFNLKRDTSKVVKIVPNNTISDYVKIKGVYYRILFSNSSIKLGESVEELPTDEESFAISSISLDKESVASVTYTEDEVTITGMNEGVATIMVTYKEGISASITVQVTLPYGATANLGDVYVVDRNGNNSKLLQDWKYFYDDGDNIYLIYSNYLEGIQIPYNSITHLGIDGYNVRGSDWRNSASQLVGYLKSTTTWNKFAIGISNALNEKGINISSDLIKAYGSPTLEWFQASYSTNYPLEELEIKLFTNGDYLNGTSGTQVSTNGYAYKKKDIEWNFMLTLDNTNKQLYFLEKDVRDSTITQNNNTKGYWLSGLSAGNNARVCSIEGSVLRHDTYNSIYTGCRPVVKIPKSDELMKILDLD